MVSNMKKMRLGISKSSLTTHLLASVIYLAGFFVPNCALAQDVSFCNGVWTNKPISECKSRAANVSGSLKDASGKDDQQPVGAYSTYKGGVEAVAPDGVKKTLLVHDLAFLASDARRKYSIRYDVEVTRQLCLAKDTTLAECDRAVKREMEQLEDRMRKEQEIALRRQELEVRQNERTGGNQAITVVNQNNNTLINNGAIIGGHRPSRPSNPDHSPGHSGGHATGHSHIGLSTTLRTPDGTGTVTIENGGSMTTGVVERPPRGQQGGGRYLGIQETRPSRPASSGPQNPGVYGIPGTGFSSQ